MADNSGIFESDSNNNNNTKDVEATVAKRRNIPRREAAKKEIHRLRVRERYSVQDVSDLLKIPKRTVERYLWEIYNEDDLILLKPTIEQITADMGIFREQVIERSRQVSKIIQERWKEMDAVSLVELITLAMNLDKAVLVSRYTAPGGVVHALAVNKDNHSNFLIKDEKEAEEAEVDYAEMSDWAPVKSNQQQQGQQHERG
jgi:hypothetical protein